MIYIGAVCPRRTKIIITKKTQLIRIFKDNYVILLCFKWQYVCLHLCYNYPSGVQSRVVWWLSGWQHSDEHLFKDMYMRNGTLLKWNFCLKTSRIESRSYRKRCLCLQYYLIKKKGGEGRRRLSNCSMSQLCDQDLALAVEFNLEEMLYPAL